MTSVQEEIRKTVEALLSDGKADLVIGFAQGALPMRTTPCFITDADAAKQLVWNSYCSNNLAVYLPRCFTPDPSLKEQPPPPKVAIIVKGCDGRSTVELIQEQQAARENLVIIAAPCEGMIDAAVAQRLVGTDEIVGAEEAGGMVTVTDETGKTTEFSRDVLLAESCRSCTHRTAPVYDKAIGDLPQSEAAPAGNDRFEEFAGKTPAERWQQFCREISKCILCKACRSACPNCYCKVCFADQTRPNWMGTGSELKDVILYHLGRIFHQAGRCVDCGACVRACSLGVDLRMFTYNLVKDAKDLFGHTAGLDLDQGPPLTVFSAEDTESFITDPE